MKNQPKRTWTIATLCTFVCLAVFVAPALSHHSFAMYDQTKTLTLTGIAHQFVAQANHAELHFYLVAPDGKPAKDKDGKPVDYGMEMGGAAAMAQQGITAESFPSGVVFSVKLNPLRDGSNFGSKAGNSAIAKCPTDPKTGKTTAVPAAGKHCDSLPGMTLLGGTTF